MEIVSGINLLCAFECLKRNAGQSAGSFAVDAMLSSRKLPEESGYFMNAVEYLFASHPYGEDVHYSKFIRLIDKHGSEFVPLMPDSFRQNIFQAAQSNESALRLGKMIENVIIRIADPQERELMEMRNSILATGKYIGLDAEPLGNGAFSVVFHAQRSDRENVAVKVVKLQEEFKDVFTNELSVWSGLLADRSPHRNIARLTDSRIIGPQNNYGLVEMEYLSGGTLEQRVQAWREAGWKPDDSWNSLSSVSDIVGCFLEICRGMEFAHLKNIYHQDLKPDNIMFDEHNIPKIVDWGIGKMKGLNSGAHFFATWNMAPEMALMSEEGASERLSGVEIEKYVDIYQLGLLFYYMLTFGDHPFLSAAMKGREGPPDPKDILAAELENNVNYDLLEGKKNKDILLKVLNKCLTPLIPNLTDDDGQNSMIQRYSSVSEITSDLTEYVNRTVENWFDDFQKTSVEKISVATKKYGMLSNRSLMELSSETHEELGYVVDVIIETYTAKLRDHYFSQIRASYGSGSLSFLISGIEKDESWVRKLYEKAKDSRLASLLEILAETGNVIQILNRGHYSDREVSVRDLDAKLSSLSGENLGAGNR